MQTNNVPQIPPAAQSRPNIPNSGTLPNNKSTPQQTNANRK